MISSSLPFVLLGALAALAPSTAAAVLSGTGIITVLVGSNGTTDVMTTTPSDAVGCINAAGKVTLNDCAEYTIQDYHIASDAGICSFKNSSQPANTDNYYGKSVYAFHCWQHGTVSSDTQFYTIVSTLLDEISLEKVGDEGKAGSKQADEIPSNGKILESGTSSTY